MPRKSTSLRFLVRKKADQVVITEGKKSSHYHLHFRGAQLADVVKVDPETAEVLEEYHTRTDGRLMCTCLGFFYFGYCRHVDALKAMEKEPDSPLILF